MQPVALTGLNFGIRYWIFLSCRMIQHLVLANKWRINYWKEMVSKVSICNVVCFHKKKATLELAMPLFSNQVQGVRTVTLIKKGILASLWLSVSPVGLHHIQRYNHLFQYFGT